MTVAATPFARISDRIAMRMSCASADARSIQPGRQTASIESRVSATFPNCLSAASRAASGSSPRSMRCLISSAMWPRISSSSSS